MCGWGAGGESGLGRVWHGEPGELRRHVRGHQLKRPDARAAHWQARKGSFGAAWGWR